MWALFPLLISAAVFADTRNQLFFKVPVSEHRLKKAWDLYANNTLARTGLLLSVLGLFFPGLAVAAGICSWIGLRRVDPAAYPPVGRKGQAIAGLVLSGVGLLIWGSLGLARLGR